jgi:phosphomannomutase
VSRLAQSLPQCVIVKEKVGLQNLALAAFLDQLQSRWSDAKINRLDGLRLDWPDRWLHVRGSNTEPVVRIIAEAPTEGEARAMIQAANP